MFTFPPHRWFINLAAAFCLPWRCFKHQSPLGWYNDWEDTGTHLSSARSPAGEWTAAEGCCPDSSRSLWSSWEWACLSPTGPQSGALSLWGRQKSGHIKDHSLRSTPPQWPENTALNSPRVSPATSLGLTPPWLSAGGEEPVRVRVTHDLSCKSGHFCESEGVI